MGIEKTIARKNGKGNNVLKLERMHKESAVDITTEVCNFPGWLTLESFCKYCLFLMNVVINGLNKILIQEGCIRQKRVVRPQLNYLNSEGSVYQAKVLKELKNLYKTSVGNIMVN